MLWLISALIAGAGSHISHKEVLDSSTSFHFNLLGCCGFYTATFKLVVFTEIGVWTLVSGLCFQSLIAAELRIRSHRLATQDVVII